jgi:hypothetical protein
MHVLRSTRLLLALAAITGATSASAQVINGNFSSGLSFWTAVGDVGVRDGAAFLTTASAAFDDDNTTPGAFNYSGNEPVASGDLELSLGLAPGALDPNPGAGNFAFEGSALFQSVTLQAGESVSFTYRFFTNDTAGFDRAFFVLDGTLTQLALGPLTAPASFSYSLETQVATVVSAPVLTAGTYLLGFGVIDGNDFISTSALQIDDVSAIPEPSTYAIMLGALALGYVIARRRGAARV